MKSIWKKIVDYAIPKQTEMSLYVLALSVLMPTFIMEFSSVYRSVNPFLDQVCSLDGIICAGYSIGLLLVILSVFISGKIPFFKSVFAPLFILLTNVYISLTYIEQVETGVLGFVFASYHIMIVLVIIIPYMKASIEANREVKKQVNSISAFKKIELLVVRPFSYIANKIDPDTKTAPRDIVIATVLVLVVFGYSYFFLSLSNQEWLIPVSTSIFLWQLLQSLMPNKRTV